MAEKTQYLSIWVFYEGIDYLLFSQPCYNLSSKHVTSARRRDVSRPPDMEVFLCVYS